MAENSSFSSIEKTGEFVPLRVPAAREYARPTSDGRLVFF